MCSAQSNATAPTTAAPKIPHPTSAADAHPVGVLVAAVPLPVEPSLCVDDPSCACPCGVDSLAFRAAACDGKGLAATPVPFTHFDGGATVPLVKVMSAH